MLATTIVGAALVGGCAFDPAEEEMAEVYGPAPYEEEVITLSCGGCGVDDEEPSTCGGNCSGCSVEGCGGLQEEDEEKEEVEETEEVESEEKVEE